MGCVARAMVISVRRISVQLDVAFADKDSEHAYIKHLVPEVSRRTIVGHACGLVMGVASLVWNLCVLDDTSGRHGSTLETSYMFVMLLPLGIQGMMFCALLVAACMKNAVHVPWELLSIIATSVFGLILPWQTPCRAAFLFGDDFHQTCSGKGLGESEVLRIVASLLIVHMYARWVPLRWRFSCIVPLCFASSASVVWITNDTLNDVSLPFKLLVLPALHLSCVFGYRCHETLLRERWLAFERVSAVHIESSNAQDDTWSCHETNALEQPYQSMHLPSLHEAISLVPAAVHGMPAEPDREDVQNCRHESEISFTYTESSIGVQDVTPMEPSHHLEVQLGRAGNCIDEQTVDQSCTLVEKEKKSTKDVAVSTTTVWRKGSFVCTTCAKPPKLPGDPSPPLSSSAGSKPRGQMRRRREQKERYAGKDFDGFWVLREEDAEGAPQFLRQLFIEGNNVILGDITTTHVTCDKRSKTCQIKNGAIWRLKDGTLLWTGSSGKVVRYDRNEIVPDEHGDDDIDSDDDDCSCSSFADGSDSDISCSSTMSGSSCESSSLSK